MLDEVEILVQGGRGGDGLISFHREKSKPKGRPDGGRGGFGGDVYFVTDPNVATLKDFASKKTFKAEDGVNGGTNGRTGKAGEDLYIKVPVGTIVYQKDSSIKSSRDLLASNQTLLIASGGKGGRGNEHMVGGESSLEIIQYRGRNFNREKSYFYAERGQVGESVMVKLELKLIADVGLIGLPNAGKSSLLNALTKTTKATVGSYPFTTLEPNLGVLEISSHLVLADLPGLIEGASKGRGLGDKFLKHIERTKVLVHVISVEGISFGTVPVRDGPVLEPIPPIPSIPPYKTIRDELERWGGELLKKPEIIVINKVDLLDKNQREKFSRLKNKGIIFTSAKTGEGVEELKEVIATAVAKSSPISLIPPIPSFGISNLPNRKMVFE